MRASVDEMFAAAPPPALAELGLDLLHINRFQRVMAIVIPFGLVGLYLAFAHFRLWALAVLTVMYLSFVTYGSISHALVHRTLGLPRRGEDFFLFAIQLVVFRSWHGFWLVPIGCDTRCAHVD